MRDEWSAYDLKSPEGIKIEVKSAAYVQRWSQKDYSTISFSIKARVADVYVFCLLHYKDKASINPLNLDHWEFYVVSVNTLNEYPRSKHSITLPSLKNLVKEVDYSSLGEAIRAAHTRLI